MTSHHGATMVYRRKPNAINGLDVAVPVRRRAETEVQRPEFNEEKIFRVWPQKSAHVIVELLTTEKTYIESLEEVIRGYLKPLYEYLFSASQGSKFIETVFCNIQKLYHIHLDLYNSMLSTCDDPFMFGQVFVVNSDNLKEYTHYCTNFPKCEELLQRVMKSEPETQDFIVQCQVDIGHPLPLITYLHKPVQRVLKYRLLLEQTLKGMAENMKGFKEVKKAVDVMGSIASEINEMKRRYENIQRVESIQKSLKGLKVSELNGGDLKSCGSLVFEENCRILGRFGGERIMMLFEACLLFLRAKGSNKYIYKWHILVEELDVCAVSCNSNPNVLKVFSVYKPSQKISIEVKSTALRDKIVDQIQSVLVKDLKQQENIRSSLKKTEESNYSIIAPTEEKQNSIYQKPINMAYKRSLVASELQSRRRARQMSTRKVLDSSEETKSFKPSSKGDLSVQKESLHKSVNRDSGIDISATANAMTNTDRKNDSEQLQNKEDWNESKDDRKLRRRTAVRRKETSRGYNRKSYSVDDESPLVVSEPPATVSYSYPLESEFSSLALSSSHTMDVESSLDKGIRLEQTESSLDKGKRTPEFLRTYSLNYEQSEPVISGRRRSDTNSNPPDPSLVLKGRQFISEQSSIEEEEEPLSEATWEWKNKQTEKSITLARKRVSSKENDDQFESSFCSNVSSLSVEDHYYITTMPTSSIISGMDGSDNITIYDTDSDESGDEWQEEKEEETHPLGDDGDVGEKSLRSYLSRAKLWGSHNEDERAISPLATLPRMSNNGVLSLLQYKHRPKLVHQASVDVLQSLPPSSNSFKVKAPSSLAQSNSQFEKSTLPPASEEDNNDLLESFVFHLPQSPPENKECHRDSWMLSDELSDTATNNNNAGLEDKENIPWILERYISDPDMRTPTDHQTNENAVDDERMPDQRTLSPNCNRHSLQNTLMDSGFQSVELDRMIMLAAEIQETKCNDMKIPPVKESVYVKTMEMEESNVSELLEKSQMQKKALDTEYKHTTPLPVPVTDADLTTKYADVSYDESLVIDTETNELSTKKLRHRSTKKIDAFNEDSLQEPKVSSLHISKSSLNESWTEMHVAVLAKVTVGIVSAVHFLPTFHQTVLICLIVIFLVCIIYFIRSYFYTTFEKDLVK